MLGAGGGPVMMTLTLVWLRPGISAGLDWAGEQQVPAASDDTNQHSLAALFSGNGSHTNHYKLAEGGRHLRPGRSQEHYLQSQSSKL